MKLLKLLILLSFSLVAMEQPQPPRVKRPAQEPVEQLQGEPKAQRAEAIPQVVMQPVALQLEPSLDKLPRDLRMYISTFLLTAEGNTPQEQLKNAAKNIRNFLMLNKQFLPLLYNVNFAGFIIKELAKRYAKNNFIDAAIALHTQAAKEWLKTWITNIYKKANQRDQNLLEQWVKASALNAVNMSTPNALKFLFDGLAQDLRKNLINKIRDAQGNSLLFIALKKGAIEIAKQLIEWGVNPNFVNPGHESAMALAAGLDLDLLKKMQAAGGNIKILTPRGTNLLGFAGNDQIASYLIQHGVDVNLASQGNNTPLHLAMDENRTDVVKVLLDAGANPNAVGEHDDTPLSIAVENDNAQIITMLLDKGAHIEYGSPSNTPLVQAVVKNKAKAVKALLDRGADPITKVIQTKIGNKTNYTPLIIKALSYEKQPGIDTFGVAKAFVLNALSKTNYQNAWNINDKVPFLDAPILKYVKKKFSVTPEVQSDLNDFITFLKQHGAHE